MNTHLPIVGVMGSGETEWADRTADLGHWLATKEVHLLTGGGAGVMASVSRAFSEVSSRRGLVIGILPSKMNDPTCRPREGYPNSWIEIPIATHLPLSGPQGGDPLSRNHINILSSTVIIALPGGPGTLSEVRLAIQYRRPIVAYLHDISELPGLPRGVPVVRSLAGVQEFVEKHLTTCLS